MTKNNSEYTFIFREIPVKRKSTLSDDAELEPTYTVGPCWHVD